MTHCYLTLPALKTYLNDASETNNDAYRRALEGVSRQLDDWLDRTFQPYAATLYYTADDPQCLMIDDAISISSVSMDQDGDRTYETTLTSTNYELAPYNAEASEQPYTMLEIRPQGQYWLTTARRGIKITGTWGYWQSLRALSATVSTSTGLNSTATNLAVSSPDIVVPGQTLLIDSEQVYVRSVSGGQCAIDRAQNGTTAAAHSTGASIQVYEYPPSIVEACRVQATRLVKRRDAPFGSFAGPTDVTENVVEVSRLDPDVEQLIKNYHRITWLGV